MENQNDIRRMAIFHYVVGFILLAVCFWDHFTLKVTHLPFYVLFKGVVIFTYFGVALLLDRNKIKHGTGIDISSFVFYFYGFIGTTYLHPSYLFTFLEALSFLCIVYVGTFRRFAAHTVLNLSLAFFAVQTMPEPDFLKEGHSIKPHLLIVLLIYGGLTLVVYWFFNRQRRKLDELTLRFASIGRQSSFLLHELKSPLARFLHRQDDIKNKEVDHIYSVIQGVELLVSENMPLSLARFNWGDFRDYLEDEFRETCTHHGIDLRLEGLTGDFEGQKTTLKLAVRNLVKNAVESILEARVKGLITIALKDNDLEVSSNGRPLALKDSGLHFSPFTTTKDPRTNLGIGLHFVESVVRAHGAGLEIETRDGMNVFRIKFKGGH